MTPRPRSTLLAVMLASALVGACGGTGGDELGTAAPTTTIRPSTTVVAPPSSSAPPTTPSSVPASSTPGPTGLDDVDWPRVIDLDCSPINEGVEVVSSASADVTGDGVDDAFVWVVCVHPTSGWPHQLEAFDGSSDPERPTRIGVLVPAADNLRGGDLAFSASTVTVRASGFAERDPNCCPSLAITQAFAWSGSAFVPGERTVRPIP